MKDHTRPLAAEDPDVLGVYLSGCRWTVYDFTRSAAGASTHDGPVLVAPPVWGSDRCFRPASRRTASPDDFKVHIRDHLTSPAFERAHCYSCNPERCRGCCVAGGRPPAPGRRYLRELRSERVLKRVLPLKVITLAFVRRLEPSGYTACQRQGNT